MLSRKLRITTGILLLTNVWLLFLHEATTGQFLTNGAATIITTCTGTYFATRLLGFKFPK